SRKNTSRTETRKALNSGSVPIGTNLRRMILVPAGYFVELAAWLCEELVVFWPAFFCSGLDAVGSAVDLVACEGLEELAVESCALARLSAQVAGVGRPLAQGSEAGFESDVVGAAPMLQ